MPRMLGNFHFKSHGHQKELFPRDPSSPLAQQFYSNFNEQWATQWKEENEESSSPKAVIAEKMSASAPYPSFSNPKTPEKAPVSLPTTPASTLTSVSSLESWKSPKITIPPSIPTSIPAPDPSSLGIAARKLPVVAKPLESVSYRDDSDKKYDDDGDNDNDKYQKKSLTQLLVALGFM